MQSMKMNNAFSRTEPNYFKAQNHQDALSKLNSAQVKINDIVYWPKGDVGGSPTFFALKKELSFNLTIDFSKVQQIMDPQHDSLLTGFSDMRL